LLFLALALLWSIARGYRPLVVYSGSMAPAISTGSVVVVKPVAAKSLNVGDVIAVRFEESGHLVTHRVQARQLVDGKWVFQTKGDANKFPDPQTFVVENAAGKVVLDIPWLGYAIVYASSPLARSVVVAILTYAVLGGLRSKSKPSTAYPLQEDSRRNGNEGLMPNSHIAPQVASSKTSRLGISTTLSRHFGRIEYRRKG
jgi:signal peptidase